MVCVRHITTLLLATVVLADYWIDNANTSVIYSMAPSQSGPGWQVFSVGTQSLVLSISNSTGNYNITLDASYCYNENYALGVCGTNDNCLVQIPFTGSGITMYVFNAGRSGMTASFSVDGGAAVSKTIQAPPPPTYQVSNVSLYDIQGLPSGNHTMLLTVLDWNGNPTSMKFDYAYVNETLVAPPATTSTSSTSTFQTTFQTTQTPTQTPAGNTSASNQVNLGGVIGGTLGGVTIAASVVIGFFYWRGRKASQDDTSSESSFGVNPFRSGYVSTPTSPPAPSTSQGPFLAQLPDASPDVPPLQRSAILRNALASSKYLSEPIRSSQPASWSVRSSPVLQPLRRPALHNADADPHARFSASHVADAASPFLDPRVASRYNLTADQLEVINQLRANRVPMETVARVVERFVSSRVPASETSGGQVTRGGSILSALPPPSYQTRAR